MTRPKVPPEQRQRTAQACESCKRRKQKCNGLQPCNTCGKRNFSCIYSERDPESPNSTAPPIKKPKLGQPQSSPTRSNATIGQSPAQRSDGYKSPPATLPKPISRLPLAPVAKRQTSFELSVRNGGSELLETSLKQSSQFPADMPNARNMSFATTQSAPDEEAIVYSQTRMLQDPTGRLLYVGDSATLSFLQLVRMMVENITGPTPFTTDPRRHRIQESQFTLSPNTRQTQLLPDSRTALVLVDSFFTNTHGMLQIFDRKSFRASMEACYSDPLNAQPSWLCLLNLVFAIGLTLATPRPSTPEQAIIEKLRREPQDRGELFFLNAKNFCDPVSGFEDADFWSVQALLLIAYYMLAKAKRNASFAYLGMAVRSAYALGLHKEETTSIFSAQEQAARRNTWRSLYILDRFISCHLGRPVAISEDECSGNCLRPGQGEPAANGNRKPSISDGDGFDRVAGSAQEAAVRSCSVIGSILKRVYQQRKINTSLATEFAEILKQWPVALSPNLQWRQAQQASPATGMAILHVNILYCHSIILLTRPFFLFILNRETRTAPGPSSGPDESRKNTKMEKFAESCLIASVHTVVLIHNAFKAGYLPQRDPFVVYFLLAASLVILSNDFVELYANKSADECIQQAIAIMAYCGEADPHANRLIFIITSFRDEVVKQRQKRVQKAMQKPNFSHIQPQAVQNAANGQHKKSDSQQLSPHTSINQTTEIPGQPMQRPTEANTDWNNTHYKFAMPAPPQPPPNALEPNITTHAFVNTTFNKPSPLSPVTFSPPSNVSALNASPVSHAMLTAVSAGLPGPLDTHTSLSSFLDISALDNTVIPYLTSEDGSCIEENLDFDTLWTWPGANGTGGETWKSDVQGVSDSNVPLFGLVDT
ncbi:hypothetical protein EJ05DRAFT_464827 [Pseudovirgaria hyperparasitica]|uniref:Zn(2)-C6 fungal-type domain-containing protein n=1 Tax=Pseudovirgaria hyperparasitica TaxID=470096 RepID=A0A6A6W5P6_9PEZI|nr:uncharacterized protein EJ05DRAFT_464827 [Pseudovirgaria hyperparasitica]KAF2757923.1 hypothetical protein EJ05DRAFT_464827 [Pseudovirgaria hyperparasitica]